MDEIPQLLRQSKPGIALSIVAGFNDELITRLTLATSAMLIQFKQVREYPSQLSISFEIQKMLVTVECQNIF